VAAGAVFTYEGGVVLVRRAIAPSRGLWVFPGGFVDLGETTQEAAMRETLEGVRVRIGLTGILDAYSSPRSDVVSIVYAGHVLSGRPEVGDEALEVRAIPPEELPWDELAFESTFAALKDYIRRFYPRVRPPRA
jgi:ADP-ribose pyrophosphatase YjhB (NUDIX family)